MSQNPTCALVLIGNELLSGRTPDENMNHIARRMSELGIRFMECRVILDDEKTIIKTLKELKEKYTYVFTTGGIGPTHDDITMESVAKLFKVKPRINEKIAKDFKDFYGEKANESMLKMAHFPEGAELIINSMTMAPGFKMGNVYCMAGVPKIMRAMLEAIVPTLRRGSEIFSKSVDVYAGESVISRDFEEAQKLFPEVDLGSYPFRKDDKSCTSLVMRSDNITALEASYKEVIAFLNKLGVDYK